MIKALIGETIPNTSTMTYSILQELKQIRGTMSEYLPFDDMVHGFSKWREKTSTSPSGKHLGIYRILIKTSQGKYTTAGQKQSEVDNKHRKTAE
jgi:hypothetical protein